MTNVTPTCTPVNPSRKDPERHRRTYEEAGQKWPTNLGKHLRLAQWLEQMAAREQVKDLPLAWRPGWARAQRVGH